MPNLANLKSAFRPNPPTWIVVLWATWAFGLQADPRSIPFTSLSIADGLPQATVNCILQDHTGFLWIGTQDGLARYDGYEFHLYKFDPTDSEALPSSWVTALEQDPSGNLWIGTQGGGLAMWRRDFNTFERIQLDVAGGKDVESVRSLLLDRSGHLWVGSFQAGLFRLSPGDRRVEHFRHDPSDASSLSSDRVRNLHEDRRGGLWIATLGGLDHVPHGRLGPSPVFEHFRHDPTDPGSLSDDRIYSVLETSNGDLWVGTEGGLNRRAAGAWRFERFRHDPSAQSSLPDDWVTDLLEDEQGRVWIATDAGLARWNVGAFDTYRHRPDSPQSLSNDRLLALYEDQGGVIWVGTQGGGLNRWHPRVWAFAHFRKSDDDSQGLSNNAVFAFSEDRAGRIYVGTLGGGVDVLDRRKGRIHNYRHRADDPGSLAGDQVTALHHDQQGDLWVGSLGKGLSRLGENRQSFETFSHDPTQSGTLSNNDISSILEDRDGMLWIATHGGGLNRRDPETGTFSAFRNHPDRADSLGHEFLSSLAVDPDGSLWIGTFGGGLERLDQERVAFEHFRHEPGRPASLADDKIFALHIDPSGTLWIGSSVGLHRLESMDAGGRFRHYLERDGLPNGTVWGIRSDLQGRLWLSTNRGLTRFDPRSSSFESFDSSHGLQSDEFNAGAHFASRNGELWFGGINGFNAFDPQDITSKSPPPSVVVTSFSKIDEAPRFDRAFLESSDVSLTYRDYYFSLELAALDFADPKKNRYRYKLEGLDQNWVDLGSRRYVTFTNLDPGKYQLRFEGSNSEGVFSEGPSFSIEVRPAPWATPWAYGLYALALVSCIGVYVRRQNRKLQLERDASQRERQTNHRLRAVDRLRDELLANTSHELRTPLYGICGMAENLLDEDAIAQSPTAKEQLETIVTSGHRLSALVNDILDVSEARRGGIELRPKAVQLSSVVNEVVSLTRPLLDGKPIRLISQVDPQLPPVWADEHRTQQILHNLLGNAAKFTNSGEIRVTAERGVDHLEVRVSDTGIGISDEDQDRIFNVFEQADGSTERRFGGTGLGLAVTRQLVELSGGSLRVHSTLGGGSTFIFTLPETTGEEPSQGAPSTQGPDPETLEAAEILSILPRLRQQQSLEAEASTPQAKTSDDEVEADRETGALVGKAKILIVDDELVNRQVIAKQLSGLRHELVMCSDGAEALKQVEHQRFDLVLLDLMMPGLSGYEVCTHLRKRFGRHELPVVLLTAKAQLADRLAGFKAGANDYLIKPVPKLELLARVQSQLEVLWVQRHLKELLNKRTEMVHQLGELIPICAACKKIRDDDGYWQQIEIFLRDTSGTELTHGLCPGCADDILSELEHEDDIPRNLLSSSKHREAVS